MQVHAVRLTAETLPLCAEMWGGRETCLLLEAHEPGALRILDAAQVAERNAGGGSQ